MTIIDSARVTSKGQITIPNRIRKLLHVKMGTSIAFVLGREGIILLPCKITPKKPYTRAEWAKIEKLASVKGKIFKSENEAKSYIDAL